MEPSPELDRLIERFTETIREVSRQENARLASEMARHIDAKLDAIEARTLARIQALQAQIERLRCEFREDVAELRKEQARQGERIADHGRAIARIEARLANGERQFEEHAGRLDKLEGKGEQTRLDLARLAASLGALGASGAIGGAAGAAIMRLLTGV
ncbi:MAG: hypothetical protein N3A38_11735 [Planctomycetota bacterium]|nr:hypothetical protein [Planctomycetota bacterium]